MYGGLACNDGWSFGGVQRTVLNGSPGEIPLRLAPGADVIRVSDVTVKAADAVTPGGSSIAVVATGSIGHFSRCDLIAGDAMDGLTGESGGAPIAQAGSGSPGAPACGNKLAPPIAPIGGAAANNSCDGITLLAGMGGLGGIAASGNGGNGEAGDFGAGGVSGTGDKAPPACASGGAGVAGLTGSPGLGGGQNGTALGVIDESGFHGWGGAAGQSGTNGPSGRGSRVATANRRPWSASTAYTASTASSSSRSSACVVWYCPSPSMSTRTKAARKCRCAAVGGRAKGLMR